MSFGTMNLDRSPRAFEREDRRRDKTRTDAARWESQRRKQVRRDKYTTEV